MSRSTAETKGILRDLGGGLVLRRATAEDTEPMSEFHTVVSSLTTERNESLGAWPRDLMGGAHPTMGPGDFTLVEDTDTGAIVSSLNLISQTWTYGGIEFGVGRVELVATDPDYRRRGLVRAQMEVVHGWSAARGEKVQAITGIPWYYRQFGYEMAIENEGGRSGYEQNVPRLDDGEEEPFRVRPAEEADLPFIDDLYRQGAKRYLLSSVRDEEMWCYELQGRRPRTYAGREIRIVESATSGRVGFLVHMHSLSDGDLAAEVYELRPGVPWIAATPSVIRYMGRTGKEYAARDNAGAFRGVAFALGSEHPAYHAAKELLPRTNRPYAWYIRVRDIPDFVRHIAPVLEQRLASSPAAGHTGELKLSFSTDGLRLGFESGRLAVVDKWMATQRDSRLVPRERDTLIPGLAFLKMLFGYRSLEDLEYAFPDCIVSSEEARGLLDVLFPKQISHLWGIG